MDGDTPAMREASVGDLVSALGDAGLSLLSDPPGAQLAVRRVVLHDPQSPLPRTQGGVRLLVVPAIGEPTAECAEDLLGEAAGRGYSAVVVRSGSADLDSLAEAADRHGIALLGLDRAVEWLHLATMLGTVLDSAARELTGRDPVVGDLFGLANAVAAAVGGSTAIEDFGQRV